METRRAIAVLFAVMSSGLGLAQTGSSLDLTNPLNVSAQALAFRQDSFPAADEPATRTASPDPPAGPDDRTNSDGTQTQGLIFRSVKRTLRDQKELYLAPFQPSSIKWDLVVLAGTGGLMATDRRIERHLPGGNLSIYSNTSNITIGGLSDINTSFPAGHAMFTTAMATVLAHEYPKPWVRFVAYGAATTVIAARFLAHDHWASDEFLGPALGYFIGSHIFHAHCNPAFNEGCRPSQTSDQP